MFSAVDAEVERLGVAVHMVEDRAAQLTLKADLALGQLEDAVGSHRFRLSQHERDTFNDKFIFALLLVVGTPCISSLLISTSPVLTYWIGNSGAVIAVACFVWMLIGHQVLVQGAVHRRLAVIYLLVIPIIALTIASNANKLKALDVHTQLSVQDCVAFPAKLRLERAWRAADALLDRCLVEEASLTGSSVEELRSIDGVQRCPGYEEGHQRWSKEWDYLQFLETYERCAGWCESSRRPLWHALPADKLRQQPDRCSLVVASSLKSQIYSIRQIIFCCLIACVVMGLGLNMIEL
jgi:hypothetical protein